MKKILVIIGAVLVVGFAAIQFVPYGHNHTNPPVSSEPAWPDQQSRDLAVGACYDCHSNETVWPWYSNIAPVSWLIQRDVETGRRHLNFSEWSTNQNKIGEISEALQYGEMPPSFYVMMHSNAKLTDAQVQTLVNGLKSSVQSASQ